MTRKAIGLHVNAGRDAGAFRAYIDKARPSVCKWLTDGIGDGSWVRYAKAAGCLTVGRLYVPDDEQSLSAEGQLAMLAGIRAAIRQYPDIDAWEGFNESFQRAPEIAARAAFDIKLMSLCASLGRKAVIGSFSVGQPQWPATGAAADDWAAYLPALQAAAAGGHYVGLHEYGGPAMQWGAGGNQMSALQGGRWVNVDPCTRPGVDGWFALRYRKAVAHWRELGLRSIPRIIITESGLDDIQPRPDVGARSGFRSYEGTEWIRHPILGDFADQLAWQSERWAEDDYVVGGVVFCYGDASGKWGAFDVLGSGLERLADRMASLPDVGKPPSTGGTMGNQSNVLARQLADKLGAAFVDLRGKLPENPNGPNGAFDLRPLAGMRYIAVHHTAGPRAQTVRAIADYHVNTNGWAGIGYHFVLRLGILHMVGDVEQARACCENQNHVVLCIVVTGDYHTPGKDNVDQADLATLAIAVDVIQAWAASVGAPRLQVAGHRDIPGQQTVCPGDRLEAVLGAVQTPGAPRPPSPTLEPQKTLRAASKALQAAGGVKLNAAAALQRAIRADGLTPTTNEARQTIAGIEYAYQRAEGLAGGAARIYYCRVGDWGRISSLDE